MTLTRTALLALIALGMAGPWGSVGQSYAAPVVRFQASARGALTITGNTLGLSGSAGLPSPSHQISIFIEANATLQAPGWPLGTTADWTLNSSDAVLDLPANATVLHAELIWGGRVNQTMWPDTDLPVTFTTPSGSDAVLPDPLTASPLGGSMAGPGYYGRSADVTALVTQAGVYRVGAVPADPSLTNSSAGWTLIVAYSEPSEPARNLSIFTVMERIASNTDADDATASVVGLCTPVSADNLGARLVLTAMEGDAHIAGDELRFGASQVQLDFSAARISGPNNPEDNFFASQINDASGLLDPRGTFGTLNQPLGGIAAGVRQGWDITNVDVSDKLNLGQSEAWIRGTSSGDQYSIFAVGVQIDLGAPRFAERSGAVSALPSVPRVGDTVTLTTALENIGDATAEHASFKLPASLPSGLSSVPNSVTIDGASVAGDPLLGFELPDLAPGESALVTFDVTVTASPDPTEFTVAPEVSFEFVDCNADVLAGASSFGPLRVQVEVCADGEIDGGETCDDGARVGLDGCSPSCEVERGWICDGPPGGPSHCRHVCGDGVIADDAEACDDGNTAAGDGCSPSCQVEPRWACDLNAVSAGTPASPDSLCHPICGDAQVVTGEEACDDGDLEALDGCSPSCEVERGWICDGVPGPDDYCRAVCGDGLRALGREACDDGNAEGLDGCSAACEVEPGWACLDNPATAGTSAAPDSICLTSCGDGVVGLGFEQCDDGNDEGLDGCSMTCQVEHGWICDGAPNTDTHCRAVCGDGLRALGREACDDGDRVTQDGCDDSCQIEHGWACAFDATAAGTPLDPDSRCATTCGDGEIGLGRETCDDADTEGLDGCSASCQIEPGWICDGAEGASDHCRFICGDGRQALGGEECDDGDLDGLDGCDGACHVEHGWACSGSPGGESSCLSRCGDGALALGAEVCDDGARPGGCDPVTCEVLPGFECAPNPSSASSRVLPDSQCVATCGDLMVVFGEECDDGDSDAGDGCSEVCGLESGWRCAPEGGPCRPLCGDGLLRGGEVCDDGNLDLGDGCVGCQPSAGWYCPAPGSPCHTVCGDGVVGAPAEFCDDGNNDSGDGCEGCHTEGPGWSCPSEGGACEHTCGDGIAVGPERCDDGNTVAGDGCDGACAIEAGWRCPQGGGPCVERTSCGDGRLNPGEACDDGGIEAGDGCSAECRVEEGWLCEGGAACAPRCGDGLLRGGEACDDGDRGDGDGCSGDCGAVELGWYCDTPGEPCETRCGDGLWVRDVEACDNDPGDDEDGCDAECEVVPGWVCPDEGAVTEVSVCTLRCGDGALEAPEICDDGNLLDGDGCSASCEPEAGFRCRYTCTSEAGVTTGCGPSICAADSDEDGLLDDEDPCPLTPGPFGDTLAEELCPAPYEGPEIEGGGGCAGGGAGLAGLWVLLGLALWGWRRRALRA